MLAVALLAQAAPLPAQEADPRCIAAVTVTITQLDEAQRTGMLPLALYYIGRATGRDPKLDLEIELARVIDDAGVFEAALPAELTRCGTEMQDVGAKLRRAGDALQRRGDVDKDRK